MASQSAAKNLVSLEQLRSEATEVQQRFLNLFWGHYYDSGKWPKTFSIHRKHSQEEIVQTLQPLGGHVAWENSDSQGKRYELHLVGILLTKDGVLYEQWLVCLLEFFRDTYFDEKNEDAEGREFTDEEIAKALKLHPTECKILGLLTGFENEFRSYGNTVGGNWKIRLPDCVQYAPRHGSLRTFHEEILMKNFDRKVPILETDRHSFHQTAYSAIPYQGLDEPPHSESSFAQPSGVKSRKSGKATPAKLFISHSSQDRELVQALTELLRAALRFPAKDILCTSVSGHKLPGGADTETELLAMLQNAPLVIGVLTPASLSSSYVLFELGARWGLRKPHIPIVAAGAGMRDIKEPLNAKNALDATDEDDVHQLVENVAKRLGRKAEPTAAYNAAVRRVVSVAKVKKVGPPRPKIEATQSAVRLLDWPKLVERMNIRTVAVEGGCMLFRSIAKRCGLKPVLDWGQGNRRDSVTCAGATLTEREPIKRAGHGNVSQPGEPTREYTFELSPEMLPKTTVAIDRFYSRIKTFSPLEITIDFSLDVAIGGEPHQITANIFESELSMPLTDMFEFRKHRFDLRASQYGRHPIFRMSVWRRFKLQSIPWLDMFTTLLQKRVLVVEKPLAKEIWREA